MRTLRQVTVLKITKMRIAQCMMEKNEKLPVAGLRRLHLK